MRRGRQNLKLGFCTDSFREHRQKTFVTLSEFWGGGGGGGGGGGARF